MKNLVLALLFVAYSSHSFGEEGCSLGNIKDFHEKYLKTNPLGEQLQARANVTVGSIERAKQRPNPEVELTYQRGNDFGIDVNNYSMDIKHVFEFGDKRNKRIQKASLQSEYEFYNARLQGIDVRFDYLLRFQRLGQIDLTIEALEEAIKSFASIISRLTSRPVLNPEETVSLSTLRLARNDYEVQLNDLRNEKLLLAAEIEFITKCKPRSVEYIPLKFDAFKSDDPNPEGLIKLENGKVSIAEADLEVARSQGYSNILVGPSFGYEGRGNDKFVTAGIGVTFALPVFHTNNGGKLESLKRLVSQKQQNHNNVTLLNLQLQRQRLKYMNSLRLLNGLPTVTETKNKLNQTRSFFNRGIISIQMTIESYRQNVDYIKARFDSENDVLESLNQIVMISGKEDYLESILK